METIIVIVVLLLIIGATKKSKNNSTKSNSNFSKNYTKKCSWCTTLYNGTDYHYIKGNNNSCRAVIKSDSIKMFDSKQYCSPKCATEAGWNNI
jgi:hypothetical protein